MTLGLILAVLAGTVAAAFVSGLSGFAFGMVALSVWAWALEPRLLAPMVVFGSLIAQLVSFGSLRQGLRWQLLLPFVTGGAAGVPLGVWLLGRVDLDLFRLAVGGVLIIYCGGTLLSAERPPVRLDNRWVDGLVGALGGVMGGLAGISGPVPTLWCSVRGWDKDVQRAVFQSFNTAMHVITLTVYGWSGLLTAEVGRVFALMLPAILLPAWLGTRLYRRISDSAFRRLVLALLLLSGCVLVVSGLLR